MPLRCPAMNDGPEKWSGRPVTLRLSPVPQTVGLLSSSGPMKWTRTPDSHRVMRFCRPPARRLCLVRDLKSGEADGCCPRSTIFTGSNAGCYITASIKWILRPALPRHGLLYERSALLGSATEESESGAPAMTCTSNLRLRRAACRICYTSGAEMSPAGVAPASRASEARILSAELRGSKWCAMPVLPRRPRFGRPPCLLLHQ